MQKAMFIFTLLFIFPVLFCKIHHSNDEYNAFTNDWDQIFSLSIQTDRYLNYDIKYRSRILQLQHCTFIELFAQMHDSLSVVKIGNFYVTELFVGFYGCFILHFGDLRAAAITKLKKRNCLFTEAMMYDNTSAKVHQGSYNIFLLYTEVHVCNYSMSMPNQHHYDRTKGLLTCFQSQLPLFLCTLCNIYDIKKCSAGTRNRINSVKCITQNHQRQLFRKEARFWTFQIPAVKSSWSQRLYPICNGNCEEGQPVVVTSCYDQVTKLKTPNKKDVSSSCPIKPKKCFFILTISSTMRTVRLKQFCFFIINCIPKNAYIYAMKKSIDNTQEINEVYNNDYEDFKCIRSLRRRLLQSIGYGCYRNMDYDAQREKSNYRRYAQYVAPAMSQNKVEKESEDEDYEDYEVSDEKADNNFEEDGGENEEEKEEYNEFGHQNHGQQIHMERSDHIGRSHTSKKQNEYLSQGNVRIRSVSKDCNEEPTEELQYYDYEISGIDVSFGNVHTLQVGYLVRLSTMYLLFIFII